MLRNVCGNLYLGVANDVIVDVVVRNYQRLAIFLAVNLVHVDTILVRPKTQIFGLDFLLYFDRFRFSLAQLVPLSRFSKDFSWTVVDDFGTCFV